jgi:uncharacterized protein YbgA (DUF1722 family)/uncharacterized protein YbbK (DUF523 family)
MSESVANEERPIRLGVSSCLLGNEVRFDGGHKRDRFVTDLLGRFIEWVPVCPEVEVGMGTPRPAMRLVEGRDGVRMVEIKSDRDHTQPMKTYSARRVRELKTLDLCGYILKKDSPSCGMTRVKIYGEAAMPSRKGRGLYATALMDAYPNLPVEDEGRLNDPKLRENFIERVFAYERLCKLFRGRWTAGQVVDFHTAHKLQLMAHSTDAYRKLGRLVATVKRKQRAVFREQYECGFMDGLVPLATPGRNANMLQHAAGHLKQCLDSPSRTELADLIHDYRKGLMPLVVPITLIGHHARRHGIDYLNAQVFLEPHPRELMLRNHV